MTTAKIIKNTEKFVKVQLEKEGTGHDWWHIDRVRNNVKIICKSEKADWFVVALAVLLHDVGDRKVINKENDDYSIAENFLKRQKVESDVIEQVMFVIKNMSFSNSLGKKKVKNSIEFQVVQDADRLDALGAIGIARAFAYGGSKARAIYDPTEKARKINSTANYHKPSNSTLHHFYEKLFRLKNLMNTKTARRIADKRHKYMQKYVTQFLSEWEGKK